MSHGPPRSASAGFSLAGLPDGDALGGPGSLIGATRSDAAGRKLVLVQAGPESGWRVVLPGKVIPREFLNRTPALSYAKAWASANRPSKLRVSGVGDFSHEWSFR